MIGDGNGWSTGPGGAKVWGRFGAAGLFAFSGGAVLMQHRAPWTHGGGTWALPGGARDSHESAADAALREAQEEAGIASGALTVRSELVTAGPFHPSGWSYTTVFAEAASQLATEANNESLELRWVPLDQVEDLPLLPAFGRSFPDVRLEARRLWHAGGRD